MNRRHRAVSSPGGPRPARASRLFRPLPEALEGRALMSLRTWTRDSSTSTRRGLGPTRRASRRSALPLSSSPPTAPTAGALHDRRVGGGHAPRQGHQPRARLLEHPRDDCPQRTPPVLRRRRQARRGALAERRHETGDPPRQGHQPGTRQLRPRPPIGPEHHRGLPGQDVLRGRRRHARHGAVGDRRDDRRHVPRLGHQRRPGRLEPGRPDGLQRQALLPGHGRDWRLAVVRERRDGRRHRPGQDPQPQWRRPTL